MKESVEWLRSHRENSLIAVALQDFTVIVIDVDMVRIIRQFEGHTGRLTDATFSPDSRWLVTASMDRTIRVWDIPSAQLVDVFQVCTIKMLILKKKFLFNPIPGVTHKIISFFRYLMLALLLLFHLLANF